MSKEIKARCCECKEELNYSQKVGFIHKTGNKLCKK